MTRRKKSSKSFNDDGQYPKFKTLIDERDSSDLYSNALEIGTQHLRRGGSLVNADTIDKFTDDKVRLLRWIENEIFTAARILVAIVLLDNKREMKLKSLSAG